MEAVHHKQNMLLTALADSVISQAVTSVKVNFVCSVKLLYF